VCCILLVLLATSAYSYPDYKTQHDEKSIFDIESSVKISITSDIDHIIHNREIEKIPAIIQVSSDELSLEIECSIEARGNFRRKKESCDFPPIRIRIKKGEVEKTIFRRNTNIKIVTHCREKSNQFLQYMAREYTTYKIHNLISPYSFQVKMVEITYIDKNDKLKPITSQAFLIEDIDNLAKKYDMKEFEGKLTADSIDHDNLLTTSVFQFMIGNSDWVIPFSKNLKFIRDKTRTILVPYDFDYTALVGTDYTPKGGQMVLMTPQRAFKGPCYRMDELEAEFKRFTDKKEEILEVIKTSPYLKSKSKSEMRNYLNEFYSIIKSKEKVKEHFLSKCN
jgi:hypothetical protein